MSFTVKNLESEQLKSMGGTCSSQCQCHCHYPTMQVPNYIPTFLHTAVRGVNGMGHEIGMGSEIGMGMGMPGMFTSSNCPTTKQFELPSPCFLDSSTTPGIGVGMPDMFPSSNFPMMKQLELPSPCFLDSSTSPGIGMGTPDMFPSTNCPMTNQLELPTTCSWDSSTTPVTGMGMSDMYSSSSYSMSNQLDLSSACYLDSSTNPGISTFPILPDISDAGLYGIHNEGISNVLEPFQLTTSCPISSPSHGMREFCPTQVINQESLGRGESCTVRGSKARDTQ